MTSPTPVRLGFVGAGGIVQRALAPAAHAAAGVVVQSAAARDRARAEAVQPAGRAYEGADGYRALVEADDVDLVYVALDNAGHLPWTLAALEAGKHVICEKPIGLTPAEVERMTDAARAADRLLVEAFWYRWHPRTRRLEQLLRQGALGPVRQVTAEFSFAGPKDADPAQHYRYDPARGGGGLYDVGCYALSLVHLVLGSRLDVVEARAELNGTGVDVDLGARLRVPGDAPLTGPGRVEPGAQAAISCGIAAPDSQVVTVTGEGATLAFGDPAFTALGMPVELTITTPDRAVRRESFAPVNPYQLMIEAVAARTRGEDAFVVDLGHSHEISQTTAAIQQAIAYAS
ncbi:Gfo/Idh/MocA family protein [Spongisporangium articulatum]|uniref:Gfo/Idh/MocA family protein n=1 Tax=Spongisporangium articulatum TaxID=3362603 RepID=A0ABW8APF2_9ACTN